MLLLLPNWRKPKLNIPEVDKRTGRREPGDPHSPELIMHWIEVCTDPAAHRVSGGSPVATNSVTHRDQLVAEWTEQGATLPPAVF